VGVMLILGWFAALLMLMLYLAAIVFVTYSGVPDPEVFSNYSEMIEVEFNNYEYTSAACPARWSRC